MSEEDGQDRTTWISPVTVSDDSKTTKRVPSRPGRGEVFARIIGVRKAVTNYETYIGYEIETVANRDDYPSDVCVVERRYREFDWLHKRFQRAYAVLFVPPLPGKKVLTQLNRYASDFVDRRCSGLQTFLRKSASHPVLSGDNDLVAFLTLPHAPFQMYMQWNSLDSSILSLVGLRTPATPSPPQNQRLLANASTDDRVETPVDPLSVGGRGSHLARVSGSTVSGRSSQSILQASEVFTRYQSEVDEYTTLCEKLSAIMNRMTGQLTTLSYTYVDLARTLEQWPADPVTAPCLTGNSNVVQLVSDAVGQMARATQRLVSELGLGPGSTWYDSANFGEAVKRALKNRSAIEEAYINVEDQIKDQRRVESCGERSETVDVAAPSPLLSLFSVIPWNKKTKKKPLEELLKEADDLRKELMFSNNQVDREWERWQSSRVEEMAMNMATLTSAYMEYWCGVAKAWRETVVHLQQTRQLSPKSVSTVSLPSTGESCDYQM